MDAIAAHELLGRGLAEDTAEEDFAAAKMEEEKRRTAAGTGAGAGGGGAGAGICRRRIWSGETPGGTTNESTCPPTVTRCSLPGVQPRSTVTSTVWSSIRVAVGFLAVFP